MDDHRLEERKQNFQKCNIILTSRQPLNFTEKGAVQPLIKKKENGTIYSKQKI